MESNIIFDQNTSYKDRSNNIELNINRWQEYQNLIKEEITLNDISKEKIILY